MQSAAQYMRRLEAAQEKTGPELLKHVLNSLNVKSIEKLDNLGTLQPGAGTRRARGRGRQLTQIFFQKLWFQPIDFCDNVRLLFAA